MNPYKIDGPAMISFSGGRTSAYMLRKILDVGLADNVHVLFANTGKERPETLDFVHDCETRWEVSVHWVEYRREDDGPLSYEEVTHATASREGEPFEALITRHGYVPTPTTRFCTSELKTRPMRNWMRDQGYDDGEWGCPVGLRADEPKRVARMRGGNHEGRWEVLLPLADAGVTEADVMAFWASQPFDLQIPQQAGNCDLCFLKSLPKKRNIIRERPDLAEWWIEQERRTGKPFRIDQPNFLQIMAQPDLFQSLEDDEDLMDCFCHD